MRKTQVAKKKKLSSKTVVSVIAAKHEANAELKCKELDIRQQEIDLEKERLKLQADAQKLQAEKDLAMLKLLTSLSNKLEP